ncbi:Arsenite oxidase subunit AioA [Gossypium arboreum]|uniref:Arsenite oxidase subunit AioA n=1 Tax=Gossypium arboreum TaxID=29729 RepID=A0A0B0PNX5_GOSAR|nr:Arsenite oxidase subunit AioA [Gossypium arboreum]KHG26567.1 Arsenite oxidase subunit AioA [Gossypium arboreum]
MANVRNQHGLDFLTRTDPTAVSLCQALTTALTNHTRACPCRAQG